MEIPAEWLLNSSKQLKLPVSKQLRPSLPTHTILSLPSSPSFHLTFALSTKNTLITVASAATLRDGAPVTHYTSVSVSTLHSF